MNRLPDELHEVEERPRRGSDLLCGVRFVEAAREDYVAFAFRLAAWPLTFTRTDTLS